MKNIDTAEVCELLNKVMEYELAGVVRYTHYSLMVSGPYRLPIVDFMKAQANESLLHAQQAGEVLTGLGGHPTQGIASIEETNRHDIYSLLSESLAHEKMALDLYNDLLRAVEDRSVYLEEYARQMIGEEELHTLELSKMLRDFEPK
tara:strand:- start:910 stop:1350 length:441 start_codon:yes stop_codon:yes gene_type:complete